MSAVYAASSSSRRRHEGHEGNEGEGSHEPARLEAKVTALLQSVQSRRELQSRSPKLGPPQKWTSAASSVIQASSAHTSAATGASSSQCTSQKAAPGSQYDSIAGLAIHSRHCITHALLQSVLAGRSSRDQLLVCLRQEAAMEMSSDLDLRLLDELCTLNTENKTPSARAEC